jgi:hypothetical protein
MPTDSNEIDQEYCRMFNSHTDYMPSTRLNTLVSPPTIEARSWSSLVMTWASQAYNPGSNPGDRIFALLHIASKQRSRIERRMVFQKIHKYQGYFIFYHFEKIKYH